MEEQGDINSYVRSYYVGVVGTYSIYTTLNYPKKPPPLKVAAKKGAESLEVYNTLEQCKIDDEKADGTFVKKRSNWKQLWVSDEDEKEQEKK